MGRPREVCDDCLLRSVDQGEAPVSSTPEVSERIGHTVEGAAFRLHPLAESGFIATDIKGRTRLWWLTPRGYRRVAGADCVCGREISLTGSKTDDSDDMQ